MWDLPESGIKPVSPVLAGEYLSVNHRGEKLKLFMYIYQYVSIKEVDLLIRAFI